MAYLASNITLIGHDDGDGSNTGMLLREGTKAKNLRFLALVINVICILSYIA